MAKKNKKSYNVFRLILSFTFMVNHHYYFFLHYLCYRYHNYRLHPIVFVVKYLFKFFAFVLRSCYKKNES